MEGSKKGSSQISVILYCSLAFIFGLIINHFILNIASGEKLSFSTLDLIGFVLSVFLAGASIVLAIAAIHLGRASETAMIQRSDDSIKLQNEVFQRTTDALTRIESSTGVTEKRIEDIITGRVGAISERVADTALKSSTGGKESPQELQEAIKSSILEELKKPSGPSDPQADLRRSKALQVREDRQKRYREFQRKILKTFSELDGVQVLKTGDGSFSGEGLELFDGVYKKDANLVGVCALVYPTVQNDFIMNLSSLILRGIINNVYLALETDKADQAAALMGEIKKTTSLLRDNPDEKITILAGDEPAIIQAIQKIKL